MTSNPVAKTIYGFWGQIRLDRQGEFKKAETCRKALRILGGEMAGSGWIDP